jgi:hypothetical protein
MCFLFVWVVEDLALFFEKRELKIWVTLAAGSVCACCYAAKVSTINQVHWVTPHHVCVPLAHPESSARILTEAHGMALHIRKLSSQEVLELWHQDCSFLSEHFLVIKNVCISLIFHALHGLKILHCIPHRGLYPGQIVPVV